MRLLLAAWLGTAAAWTAAPKLGSSRAAGASSSSTRSSMLPSMLLEEAQGPEALLRLCATARSKCCLGGAPARRLYLPRARLTALGSSARPGRGHATASAARPSRLQGRRVPCLCPSRCRDRSWAAMHERRARPHRLARARHGGRRTARRCDHAQWQLAAPLPSTLTLTLHPNPSPKP